MASSIPTQLSPGVKISEIDLSQFIQPFATNRGGMAGIFNWGPGKIVQSVSSESELAEVFGNPTLDGTDTFTEEDFFAASNFLRYSNNLKVIRVIKSLDANAASADAGITGIGSCTNRIIPNADAFYVLGGYSGSTPVEPIAKFRAKYPGNFGNSLRVIVFDGNTGETILPSYVDYTIANGYALGTTGITSGALGYTFSAEYSTGLCADGSPNYLSGSTHGENSWFMTTLMVPGMAPAEFINRLSSPGNFETLYAIGSTLANYTLTQSGTNPSGNAKNYHSLEDAVLKDGSKYNPFSKYNNNATSIANPKNIFAQPNPVIANAVDILFINGDKWNMCYDYRVGNTFGTTNSTINRLHGFTYHGIPTHFGNLIFNEQLFDLYRTTWSKVYTDITGVVTTASTPTVRGWASLIGSTTNPQPWTRYINGVASPVSGITFANITAGNTLAALKEDFVYGVKQFGRSTNNVSVETREDLVNTRVFDKVPGTSKYAAKLGGSNDEISIAIIDSGGKFGPKNSVIEKFELLSKAVDVKSLDGESIYYKDYINKNSKYVYLTNAFGYSGGGTANSTATISFGDITSSYVSDDGITYTNNGYYDVALKYGVSSPSVATISEKLEGYSKFADNDSAVDILFMQESSNEDDSVLDPNVLERMVYDTVISSRKDTLFIVPTPKPSNFNQHTAQAASKAISFRKNAINIPSNSYTMVVSGRKLYFDTFNNQIRRMSLSSDLAGILSGQEIPWESPAGINRGILRNAIKLETNYSKVDRDDLYKNNINFFVQFNDGTGTVLFGDKTLLTKPSAFDRVNVRRMFIAVEKAIAQASKYSLFEFNDEFTRSQFRNLVNPFLAGIQAQRGLADFKVVCDNTNNTQEVIDKNQFVADIYIKPLKSINFIQLNFIAVRSDFSLTTIE